MPDIGQFGAGNIDLTTRPIVRNLDGSVSTLKSFSFQDDNGNEVLLPLVGDEGRILSPLEAIRRYSTTGRHLGQFPTPSAADDYANVIHERGVSGTTYGRDPFFMILQFLRGATQ